MEESNLPPLRPYQAEAVERGVQRGNLLLALTMGAGKTRVAIETIRQIPGACGAVFCTSSLKFQWEAEIKKWWPEATVTVIDGTKKKREALYKQDPAIFTVLSYDMLIHDWDLLSKYLPIDFVIADEATMIKSFRAKRSKRLKAIGKLTPIRIALSGQPVENKPEELFSIMEFVDPEVLGPFHKFDRTFITRDHWGKPLRYKNLDTMKSHLKEAMVRKSRKDIEEFLPKRVETDVPVHLDQKSAKLYDYIRRDLLVVLEEMIASGGGGFNLMANYGRAEDENVNRLKGQVMSRITCMRLLCNNPQLLMHSAKDFEDEETSTGSAYASYLLEEGLLDKLPLTSSKMRAFLALVSELREEDAKVVVFSGFKKQLSLLASQLKEEQIGYTTMNGDTPAKQRKERMDLFQTNPAVTCFLSSDAGAYGINLDRGSHLINFDLPWSAGALDQRVARIDRLSSDQEQINLMYMYTAGTIEERQYGMLNQKSKIADAFLDGEYDASGSLQLDPTSLREFLSA